MNRYITLLVLLLLGLSSCRKEWQSGAEGQTSGNIRFQIGFAQDKENKATSRPTSKSDFNSSFIAGDTIGIFAVPAGQNLNSAGNAIHNIPLIFDGTSWKTEVNWPSSAADFDFYAYYPYRRGDLDPRNLDFVSRTDQSRTADFAASDLLWAKATGVPVGNLVSLQFQHLMAMLQVEIPPSDFKGVGPDSILQVNLLGVGYTGKLNLQQGTFERSAQGSANIAMFRVEKPGDSDYNTSFTYRALLPQQSISRQKNLLLLKQPGQSRVHKPAVPLELNSGKLQQIEVRSNFIKTSLIPAGTFLMGDTENIGGAALNETPRHHVSLTKGFYIGSYEITNGQYVEFLNALGANESINFVVNPQKTTEYWLVVNPEKNGISVSSGRFVVDADFKNRPIMWVTWNGAMAYAKWVGGTLPTEAQWEYAARAGTQGRFFFEGTEQTLGDVAWYSGNSDGQTHDVGTKKPNPWGLYDIYGNVYEWCMDSPIGYTSSSKIDPNHFSESDDSAVTRGGGFVGFDEDINSTVRSSLKKYSPFNYIGIRVVFQP